MEITLESNCTLLFFENLRYGKFAQFPVPQKRIGIDFYIKLKNIQVKL